MRGASRSNCDERATTMNVLGLSASRGADFRRSSAMRIHITGNAGAGKTTLARELGARLGMPVIHLDRVVWQPGWKKVPLAEKEQRLREISETECWLIEGVSAIVRQRADLVVFLDVPRPICLWRCMKRNWRFLFRSRPELPDNCPELLILPRLLELIWKFPSLVGARIHSEARGPTTYVVIRRPSDVAAWLDKFASDRLETRGSLLAVPGTRAVRPV